MNKVTLKMVSILTAVSMAVLSLEASSMVSYHSDSDTEEATASSSSSSTSTSTSTKKTKSKRTKDKNHEDLASFLLETAKTHVKRTKNSSEPRKIAAELRYAAFKGDEATVARLLLNPVCDICDTDSFGNTALHYAAAAGNDKLIQMLLEFAKKHKLQSRVVPNQQTSKEKAWDYGNMVKSLVGEDNIKKYGSYLVSDEDKVTEEVGGLIEGIFSLFLEPDEKLKKRNDASSLASIPFKDIRNKHMATALHYAVAMGHLNSVRILLDYQVNHEVCAFADKESCQWYPGRPLHVACLRGDKLIAQLLIARKADINAVDATKRTTLHAAAIGGCQELVQELLDRGVKEVLGDADGKTPVQCAYDAGHYVVAAFFLTYRGGPNNFDENGLRPLHFAAMADDCALAARLEKEGALLHPLDNKGFGPVHYAAQKGALKMLNWCLDRVPYLSGFSESLLCTAARAGQKESVTLILKRAHEIQPDPIDIHSDTGLSIDGRTMPYTLWGLEERLPDFVDVLLSEGKVAMTDEVTLIRDLWKALGKKSKVFEPYPVLETAEGATPLHLAVEVAHKELCKVLLKSLITYELLKDSRDYYKELEALFMRPKMEAHAKEVERVTQRNREAREKGFTEQEMPVLEPFDWKKDFEEKVLEKEEKSDKTRIEDYPDDVIWKIVSASCWWAIRDQDEELSEDVIRLVERTIRERILPLIGEERLREVLIPRVSPIINVALSRKGKAGSYANITPPAAIFSMLAVIEEKRRVELEKAQDAKDKARAASIKEHENWNLQWSHFGQQAENYRNEAFKFQEIKEQHLDEEKEHTKRADELKEVIDKEMNYKRELDSPELVEKLCKEWFNLV